MYLRIRKREREREREKRERDEREREREMRERERREKSERGEKEREGGERGIMYLQSTPLQTVVVEGKQSDHRPVQLTTGESWCPVWLLAAESHGGDHLESEGNLEEHSIVVAVSFMEKSIHTISKWLYISEGFLS